jgi:hypothetical protein
LKGAFLTLYVDLWEDGTMFFNYFRMSPKILDELFEKAASRFHITSNHSMPISPMKIFCVNLRWAHFLFNTDRERTIKTFKVRFIEIFRNIILITTKTIVQKFLTLHLELLSWKNVHCLLWIHVLAVLSPHIWYYTLLPNFREVADSSWQVDTECECELI